MNRFIAAGAAAVSALVLLTGCSGAASGNSGAGSSSQARQERVSTNPLDKELLGEWLNDTNGFRFQEDRKVSLLVDAASMLYFKDGKLVLVEDEKDVNDPEFDGTNLKVTYNEEGFEEPISIIELERKEPGPADVLDGEYKLVGGVYMDVFASSFSIDKKTADIDAVIDGESFRMTVNNYCSYDTTGGNLLEMFSPDMDYVDSTATSVKYNYSISGDVLTLTYDDVPVEYKKVK